MSPSASRTRWLLAVATTLATLLYTVDSTIVNVALPHIQGTLQATQDQAAWIVTAYIVTSAIAMPLAGWLGARYGLRRILLLSIMGFTAGSVLCGIAGDLTEMVLFRVLQGYCGAALVPLSQVALLQEFPRESHGRVMALWGVGVMVGPILGPTLGGWLTQNWDWRWVFYINVPIGVVTFLGLSAYLAPGKAQRTAFDWFGFAMLGLAIGAFQTMLDRGEQLDWFGSTEIVVEAVVAGLAFYLFLVQTFTAPQPFIDPAIFRDRNFVLGLCFIFVVGIILLASLALITPYL